MKIKKFLESKKAQLGPIEAKFFMMGLILAIILVILLVYLANKGILPFRLRFLCPVGK